MKLAGTTQADLRVLARLAERAAQQRSARRFLGPRTPRAHRLALLERQLPADPRRRVERPVAGARPGVPDPRREHRRSRRCRRNRTIRALALAPDQYVGKGVTVTGRFRGANLFADLPQGAGTKGRWDFVLQSADSAIWVTRRASARPRLRSRRQRAGRHRPLAPGRRHGPPHRPARLDRGDVDRRSDRADRDRRSKSRCLRHRRRRRRRSSSARRPPAKPTPTAPAPIRIQFSRDMDGRTFRDKVRLSYVGPRPAGAPATPPASPSATSKATARSRSSSRRRSTASGP